MTIIGYQITLHKSLVMPVLFAGVPRRFAILNGTFCAALVLGLHAWYVLPICLLVHIVAVYVTKRDPYFFDVLNRHLAKKSFYGI